MITNFNLNDFYEAIQSIKNCILVKKEFNSIIISEDVVKNWKYSVDIELFIKTLFELNEIHGVWHGNGYDKELSISVEDAENYDVLNSVLVKICKVYGN